jgi:hypothetical protein
MEKITLNRCLLFGVCKTTIEHTFDTTAVDVYKNKEPLVRFGLVMSFSNRIPDFNFLQHSFSYSILISSIVIHVLSLRDPFTASSPAPNNASAAWKAGRDGCVDSPILHLPVTRPFPSHARHAFESPHVHLLSTTL